MAVRIPFNQMNNVIQPTFMLATRSANRLGSLHGYYGLHIADHMNAAFELIMNIDKYHDGVQLQVWDKLVDFKLIYCPEWDIWLQAAVETDESNETKKIISATALGEAELSQINIHGVEINTEEDINREDYRPTILFNADDPGASLLHRIMEKAPHYTIRHVDASIAKLQRTFSFDKKNITDTFQAIATEIKCIFVIDSGMGENGKPARAIDVYDLESYCLDCNTRGDFLHTCPSCAGTNIKHGYGEDTSIFISTENLADDIHYVTDTDSVKNCFKLEAGDDLMTAALVSCNPNGSGYIWYISDDMREDMSSKLTTALKTYDELYAYYQNDHVVQVDTDILSAYNAIVQKYSVYKDSLESVPHTITGYASLMNVYYDTIDLYLYLQNELMPSVEMQETNAQEQATLLNSSTLSPVAVTDLESCSTSTATSAVLAMAKTIIDPRYRVKVKDSTYANHVWHGSFIVTSYSDEEDYAESATIDISINDDYESYVKQRILKAIPSDTAGKIDIGELFALDLPDFKNEIKKYCMVSLQSFVDACQSCLDILIEQGIANTQTWLESSNDLYDALYLPYYYKMRALENEIRIRETEIETVIGKRDTDNTIASDGMQTVISRINDEIHQALNFEEYLGEELWLELVAYRRDDVYQNQNYISDGLTNKEIFAQAREFIEIAQKEIRKSATLQHSISSTLKNLLAMKEFAPIVDHFSTGNWIRACVDEKVYRLRLISYEVDFDDLQTLPVEFSDVTHFADSVTDTESLLEQASSMATSYDSVKRQATKGDNAKKTLDGWVDESMALTRMKIVDRADNQNISWDEHGFICREYIPIIDDYDDKQLKIINRGVYVTDDDWLTSRAGIGDFQYYDPESGEIKNSYGVIADTLIGNLILSQKVGIYNMDNSIVMDHNGFSMTTNGEMIDDDQKVFTIQRKDFDNNGVEVIDKLFYVDNDGNLVIKGGINATSLNIQSGDTMISMDEYMDNTLSGFIIQSDTEPEHPAINTLWLDTSDVSCSILKRWDGTQWIETTITQDDIDRMDGVLSSNSQLISAMQGQINLRVTKEEYQAGLNDKLDADWVSSVYSSEMKQTAQDIELVFTRSKEYTNESVGGLNTFKEEVQSYQRFSEDGLELGKINDPFKVRLSNEKLSFLDNDVEIAYVSNNKLHITDARVTNSLSIGTDTNGYFDWVTESSGLGMKWKKN